MSEPACRENQCYGLRVRSATAGRCAAANGRPVDGTVCGHVPAAVLLRPVGSCLVSEKETVYNYYVPPSPVVKKGKQLSDGVLCI